AAARASQPASASRNAPTLSHWASASPGSAASAYLGGGAGPWKVGAVMQQRRAIGPTGQAPRPPAPEACPTPLVSSHTTPCLHDIVVGLVRKFHVAPAGAQRGRRGRQAPLARLGRRCVADWQGQLRRSWAPNHLLQRRLGVGLAGGAVDAGPPGARLRGQAAIASLATSPAPPRLPLAPRPQQTGPSIAPHQHQARPHQRVAHDASV
ncbi:hypothetical protein APUTEX25_002164, partial [Auxenochlorella protothecoides]